MTSRKVPCDLTLLAITLLCQSCARSPEHSRPILYTSQAPRGTEDLRVLDPTSGASALLIAGDSASSRSLATRSPSGRQLAWVRELSSHDELYVSDASGMRPRRLGTGMPAAILFPDWSPEGMRLLVSAGRTPSHLGVYLLDVRTGRAEAIREDSSSYRCPSWAPDGTRFVVASYQNANSSLLVMNPRGKVLNTLIRSDSTYLDCPQWSPTGDAILFTIFHGGSLSGWERAAFHSNLAVLSLSSGKVTQITHDAGLTNYGKWSRDGGWIVFQSDRHAAPNRSEAGAAVMLQHLEIWTVRSTGTELRRLTTNDYFDAHPSW